MITMAAALERAKTHRRARSYPGKGDPRYDDGIIFPDFSPKFELDLSGDSVVFTIGSCFARNIESALKPLGVTLPTRRFQVPKDEWRHRPNGLLNEFNPGAISQRIVDALNGATASTETLVPVGEVHADLLLVSAAGVDVPFERAVQRRAEIDAVYRDLATSDVTIVTLGLVECWYDHRAGRYLNRMPPMGYATSDPNRFEFRVLNVEQSLELLEPAFQGLQRSGTKVILSVSPVPLRTTFRGTDPVLADAYSKSVLRVCADELSRNYDNVDYFPSFEIVKSGGTSSYNEDNIHVSNDLVNRITTWMVSRYAPGQTPAVPED